MSRCLVALGALSLMAAGCASLAPEACTDVWFEREAREAFKPIRRDLGPTINRLRSAADATEKPGPLTAVRVAIAVENVARLVEAFDAKALPRLRAAADQCNDPAFVRRAVFDFLDDEGLDEIEAVAETFATHLEARPD